MKIGLTSVTFREKSVDEIIDIAKRSNIYTIEWGADGHVTPLDAENAVTVYNKCQANGIETLSYGSYYRGGDIEEFIPILNTAVILHAKTIRIWAGRINPYDITDSQFEVLVNNIKKAAQLAEAENISISLEYHRKTMTQTKEGALKLLQAINMPNVFTYWQPNPDISLQEKLEEISLLAPYISHFHVFSWDVGNVFMPFEFGLNEWTRYLNAAKKYKLNPLLIMEFVKDSTEQQLIEDLASLRKII